jgi:hypothetical protein
VEAQRAQRQLALEASVQQRVQQQQQQTAVVQPVRARRVPPPGPQQERLAMCCPHERRRCFQAAEAQAAQHVARVTHWWVAGSQQGLGLQPQQGPRALALEREPPENQSGPQLRWATLAG